LRLRPHDGNGKIGIALGPPARRRRLGGRRGLLLLAGSGSTTPPPRLRRLLGLRLRFGLRFLSLGLGLSFGLVVGLEHDVGSCLLTLDVRWCRLNLVGLNLVGLWLRGRV